MKEQKNIVILSLLISVISLATSVILELYYDEYKVLIIDLNFLQNICLGIFTGTIVSLILGLRTYFVHRSEMLKSFWLSTEKYRQKIQIFCFKYFPRNECDNIICNNLEKSENFDLIEEINDLNSIYADQVEQESQISFFRKSGKLAKCVHEVKGQMDNINLMISDLMFFHPRMEEEVLKFPNCRKIDIIRYFRNNRSAIDDLEKANNELKMLLKISVKHSK